MRTAGTIWRGSERIDVSVPVEFQLCDCERSPGDLRSVVPTPVEVDDHRHDAWSEYLSRWSCSYPCRVVARCEKQILGPEGYYLRIRLDYPDERDSRDPLVAMPPGGLGLWPPSDLPDENTPRWLRSNVLYHLCHELDEHLKFDGIVVFNPHVSAVHVCGKCAELAQGCA